jgi:hypothetical protein
VDTKLDVTAVTSAVTTGSGSITLHVATDGYDEMDAYDRALYGFDYVVEPFKVSAGGRAFNGARRGGGLGGENWNDDDGRKIMMTTRRGREWDGQS